MHSKSNRTFWTTVLFYAVVGPLVGLAFLVVISLVVEAWGPITDRLAALIPHPQDPSCDPRMTGHFELRCFQRFEPRRFRGYDFSGFSLGKFSMVVLVTYFIGLLPALLAGLSIGAIGMSDGGVRLRHAVVIGMVLGLIAAVIVVIASPIFRPENAILLFLICLAATLVCWLVVGRWWRRAEPAATNPTVQLG